MQVDGRSDLVGGRIDAIEFVISCPRDPDGAEGDDDARTVGWQGNRGFLGTALRGISAHLIVVGDCTNDALANRDPIPGSWPYSPASEEVSRYFLGHPVCLGIDLVNRR